MPTGEALFEATDASYPLAGEYVDGRLVLGEIYNTDSIGATLTDWEELPGVREVPLSAFEINSLQDLFYNHDDIVSTKALAEELLYSREIAPLIVVVEPGGPYVLEGAHRLGALHLLGAKSFPALVVVSMEEAEGPNTVGQPSYEEFKAGLEAPPATVLPQYSYRRHLTPCNPPEDPDWPTPHNAIEATELMLRLPIRQQVICALVAAEMTLPIYEEVYPESESEERPSERPTPQHSLAVTWAWVHGEATVEEVWEARSSSLSESRFILGEYNYERIDEAPASAVDSTYTAAQAVWQAARDTEGHSRMAARSADAGFSANAARQAWGMSAEDFYAWWWRECRCRLPFTDVTETPLLTTGQPPHYEPLKEYLETPGTQVLPVQDWTRYQQPCDPPDDPNWPTPTNNFDVEGLFLRLPHKQKVICSLVAAEMVLPFWEEVYPNDTQPMSAIQTTYRWLEGKASAEEVTLVSRATQQEVTEARHIAQEEYGVGQIPNRVMAAWYAATSASEAAWMAIHHDQYYSVDERLFEAAVFRAATAYHTTYGLGLDIREFLELWWKECRCRLAFTDPSEAELLTTGQPPYESLKEYLRRGERHTSLVPELYHLRLKDCDPPEDPEWPTPTDRVEAERLLTRLPLKQQVLCALIAAELVLPIYEQRYPDDDRPRLAIETTYAWVEDRVDINAVHGDSRAADDAATDAEQYSAPGFAASASVDAGFAASWAADYGPRVGAPQTVTGYAAYAAWHGARAAEIAEWMTRAEFFELWWKECRCRLAFGDPEKAELTTGQPSYEEFKTHLEEPPTTTLPQRGYERYLTPCDPPDDPEWPTPRNHSDIHELLGRLAHKQQVICALTAAEMVLPIFEQENPNNDRPRVAINATYRWIEGQASREEVRDAANATARPALDSAAGAAAYDAAYAASYDPIYDAASAVDAAASAVDAASVVAVVFWGIPRVEFYELWWKECRCRLAFSDVGEAELTTSGREE